MDQAAVLRESKANLGLPWETIAQKLGLTKRRVLALWKEENIFLPRIGGRNEHFK